MYFLIHLLLASFARLIVAYTPSDVPVSAQIGALNFGVTCKLPLLGSYAFAGYFTATAPLQGREGSEIYYTNVTAAITIPKTITTLGRFAGAKTASANVRLALNLANASPEVFHVFPDGLQLDDITFTPGQALTVPVPVAGTLPPIGPVTLGSADRDHAIHLGDVSLALTINIGAKPFGPLKINCPSPEIKYRIGTVNIMPKDEVTDETFPSTPTINAPPNFAEISNGQQTGSFKFPYSCKFGDIQQDIAATITGSAPNVLQPGGVFHIPGGHAFFHIPSEFIAKTKAIAPSAVGGRINFDEFRIHVINGSPPHVNCVQEDEAVEFTFEEGKDVEISAQRRPELGPITAAEEGAEVYLQSGVSSGKMNLFDADGATLETLDFKCESKYKSLMLGIPLSEKEADPIGPVRKGKGFFGSLRDKKKEQDAKKEEEAKKAEEKSEEKEDTDKKDEL